MDDNVQWYFSNFVALITFSSKKDLMKKPILQLTYILLSLLMFSCSSTQETASPPQQTITSTQMAQWEEQQRVNEGAQRLRLDQEEVRKLKEYAENKARLACKLQKLDEASSQAFSEVDQADFKQQIIVLDQELNTLSREIDEYCKDNELRSKFFYHLYKQYSGNCN